MLCWRVLSAISGEAGPAFDPKVRPAQKLDHIRFPLKPNVHRKLSFRAPNQLEFAFAEVAQIDAGVDHASGVEVCNKS